MKGSKGAEGGLFSRAAGFDAELDAMFAAAPPVVKRAPVQAEKEEDEEEDEEVEKDEDEEEDEEEEEEENDDGDEEVEDIDEVDEADIEPTEAAKAADPNSVPADTELEELSGAEDWDEDQMQSFIDGDARSKSKQKVPLEDPKDTDVGRNKRTIFVGNIPIAAVTSRALRKQLIRHIENLSPYPECTKIVSLRFRSVSFRVPTNDFAQDEEAANAASKRRERARKFREMQGEKDKEDPTPSQPLLTAQQKRKIAYINQEVNEKADAVNAYVRIGEPRMVHAELAKHSKTDAAYDARVTGAVLAALLARAMDNSLFSERHLRADLVTPLAPHEIIESGLDKVRLADGTPLGGHSTSQDLKRTLFVGNLDFEAGEEEVRALFEKLVHEERGEPPAAAASSLRLDGASGQGTRRGEWVQSVRIVRDKATQLGKGFAYVKFYDVACVDELLAMHEAEEAFIAAKRPQARGKVKQVAKPIELADGETFRRRIKLRKRALRLSRCKNTNTSERPRKRPASDSPRTPPKRRADASRVRSSGAPTPNGSSPTVRRSAAEREKNASYLASLSKDQRALAKKSDPERQARRMNKKQGKKAAEKVKAAVGSKRDKVKLPQRSAAKKMAGSKKAK